MTDSDRTATLVATRLFKADREDDLDRWAGRMQKALLASPGALGSLRLDQPGGLVHFVHRFASEDDLRRWTDSPERRALVEEADAFSSEERQTGTGPRVSLRLPSEAATPKWKTWIATWACAYPVVLLVNAALGLLPFTLPQFVELALTSLALIATLNWLILPRIRKHLRPWLLDDPDDGGLRRKAG